MTLHEFDNDNNNNTWHWRETPAMPPTSQIRDVVKSEIKDALYDHPQIVEFIDVLNNFGKKFENIEKTLNTLLERDAINTEVDAKNYDNIMNKLDNILNKNYDTETER